MSSLKKEQHGMRYSKEYSSWQNMKSRCRNPKNKNYFGRNITVSPKWAESFMAFYEELGPMPKDGQRYSIDRIDNDKGYVSGNCRWSTIEQQLANRRPYSEDARRGFSIRNMGRKHNESTKEKMSIARKKWHLERKLIV